MLDRGPDSRKGLDLLMKLEPQAARAGGYLGGYLQGAIATASSRYLATTPANGLDALA